MADGEKDCDFTHKKNERLKKSYLSVEYPQQKAMNHLRATTFPSKETTLEIVLASKGRIFFLKKIRLRVPNAPQGG